ncbi:hypothetical protein OAO87_01865 [bacterium]|nr:hypothetical protein [bacterium]
MESCARAHTPARQPQLASCPTDHSTHTKEGAWMCAHAGIGHFQAITLRLIAERLVPDAAGNSYVAGELVSKPLRELLPPIQPSLYHCYCSPVNPGALELMHELATVRGYQLNDGSLPARGLAATKGKLHVATDVGELPQCQHMMLYLTGQTWTRGGASETLTDELTKAMDQNVHVRTCASILEFRLSAITDVCGSSFCTVDFARARDDRRGGAGGAPRL